MAEHRIYSIEFRRQVAQELLAGETLHSPKKRWDPLRNLVRIWVQKFEAGALDEESFTADLVQQYEARIAALERMVGKQALEYRFAITFDSRVRPHTAASSRLSARRPA